MKHHAISSLLAALTAAATVAFAADTKTGGCPGCTDCPGMTGCAEPAAAKPGDTVKRHALKGVVTGINAEKSALMVKHEEIPGVMRAMTMMFKVDAATLKSAQKGQNITGLMSRQGDSWVLENVKVAAAK